MEAWDVERIAKDAADVVRRDLESDISMLGRDFEREIDSLKREFEHQLSIERNRLDEALSTIDEQAKLISELGHVVGRHHDAFKAFARLGETYG